VRLSRPYTPLAIRLQVAARQCRDHGMVPPDGGSMGKRLQRTLAVLAMVYLSSGKLELHHRPALCNRQIFLRPDWEHYYVPAANDPEYLVYLPKGDHDVETRVRGVGAQRSDLGQRRYNKKVAKNRVKDKKRPGRWRKRKLRSRAINPGWRRKRTRKGEGWPSSRPLGGWRSRAKASQRPPPPRRGLP
jgi:hypothetical protein